MRKITRDAFLYMEPRSPRVRLAFAQCLTCALLVRPSGICAILGFEVKDEDTCGLYVPEERSGEQIVDEDHILVSTTEAGYEQRKVRCENCAYGGERCGLYVALNQAMPEKFDLEEKIVPKGCCNANTPREP